ncbi:hypothetical protein OE88DRAFT_1739603 [Heliocybe sulcata]|uniref:Uncharacterized protein n=1 Tax=Heliocybe sulcata TaxID=5364 RepID=A0A5C3MLP6_9AGAM|nr:hypothetical protein OE88DRAFT_1739603 [Heliocybe sulcata]
MAFLKLIQQGLQVSSLLNPAHPLPASWTMAIGVLGIVQSILADSILLTRLFIIYPWKIISARRRLLIFALPIAPKFVRTANLIAYIKTMADICVNPEALARLLYVGYLKAESFMQLADNMSAAFLLSTGKVLETWVPIQHCIDTSTAVQSYRTYGKHGSTGPVSLPTNNGALCIICSNILSRRNALTARLLLGTGNVGEAWTPLQLHINPWTTVRSIWSDGVARRDVESVNTKIYDFDALDEEEEHLLLDRAKRTMQVSKSSSTLSEGGDSEMLGVYCDHGQAHGWDGSLGYQLWTRRPRLRTTVEQMDMMKDEVILSTLPSPPSPSDFLMASPMLEDEEFPVQSSTAPALPVAVVDALALLLQSPSFSSHTLRL